MYARYIKRWLDFILSLLAIIILSPILLIVALLVRIKLGSPVIFKQERPGLHEKIFTLYKFRTMTDEKDKDGNLLPDDQRLTKFGKLLRSTSLDELPELFNILKGDMSIVGPRPQLVEDMIFMSLDQRQRHNVRQGLTGLSQINGRNNITWEEKLRYDLDYIQNITFFNDLKIIFKTIYKVCKRENISTDGMETSENYGDYLLRKAKITKKEYEFKLLQAQKILSKKINSISKNELVSIIMPSYNTVNFIGESINSVLNQSYSNWELIIVDDCSSDNTEEVVKKYLHDKRIKYLKNKKNLGAALSRNKALKIARGRWIAFLDSDDLWSQKKLEKQINFMKKNNFYFSYTNYKIIDEESKCYTKKVSGPKKINKFGMFAYCWPGCLTVMYDAKYIGVILSEDIKKNNDYTMWLTISKKTTSYILDEVLAIHRKRTGSISNQKYTTLIQWHFKLFYSI